MSSSRIRGLHRTARKLDDLELAEVVLKAESKAAQLRRWATEGHQLVGGIVKGDGERFGEPNDRSRWILRGGGASRGGGADQPKPHGKGNQYASAHGTVISFSRERVTTQGLAAPLKPGTQTPAGTRPAPARAGPEANVAAASPPLADWAWPSRSWFGGRTLPCSWPSTSLRSPSWNCVGRSLGAGMA